MTMMTSSHHLQFEFRSRPHCPPFRGIRVLENPKSISSFSPLLSFIFCSNSSPVFCGGLHQPQLPRCLAGFSQSKATSESNVSTAASLGLPTASEVIRDFYDGINRRDLESVELLIGVECVYEDLIFSKPFVGRKATMEFFKKFTESISSELQFVIDEISSEDTSSVGVTWHLEWRGRPFPFSKGCSFYRLEQSEGTRKIIYTNMTSRISVANRGILCYCGLPSPLLTSRQSNSCGRQFYGCAKSVSTRCGFFRWADSPTYYTVSSHGNSMFSDVDSAAEDRRSKSLKLNILIFLIVVVLVFVLFLFLPVLTRV